VNCYCRLPCSGGHQLHRRRNAASARRPRTIPHYMPSTPCPHRFPWRNPASWRRPTIPRGQALSTWPASIRGQYLPDSDQERPRTAAADLHRIGIGRKETRTGRNRESLSEEASRGEDVYKSGLSWVGGKKSKVNRRGFEFGKNSTKEKGSWMNSTSARPERGTPRVGARKRTVFLLIGGRCCNLKQHQG
jgi:hypothetical protein